MIVDGQTYSTVEIGNQIWTASNVSIVPRDRFGAALNEGRPLPQRHQSDWVGGDWVGADGQRGEYYTYYFGGEGTAADEDGYYYTWYAAQNVCPAGWRLPSDQDWQDLEEELGMPEAYLTRTAWSPNREAGIKLLAGGTNGFNAKLAGQPHSRRGGDAWFWSSTASYYRQLRPTGDLRRTDGSSTNSMSVRCLKNN
jgi:uncharacterized protein (TIGR02145 family)